MSQATDVFDRMVKYGSITAKQAEDEIGCMRLASRIGDLKSFGIEIGRRMIPVLNRNGETRRVAEYFVLDVYKALFIMAGLRAARKAAKQCQGQ